MAIRDFEELRVYQTGYKMAMDIFTRSKMVAPAQWCGPATLREPDAPYDTD